MSVGVISMGIHAPIIREGDNLQQIILDSIFKVTDLKDGDIIGITESIVARAQGNYVTVDEIAQETIKLFGKDPILILEKPIYSRNRFSMILKGLARAAKEIIMIMPDLDEVGNPRGVNPWTGVDIQEYYKDICVSENCHFHCFSKLTFEHPDAYYLDCSLRPIDKTKINLTYFFKDRCEWGLLGSNKANEETLKLFPNSDKAVELVYSIKNWIKDKLNLSVEIMIFGDGAFKDPVAKIWEFADPVTSPAYTSGLEGSPNEIKLKAFADDKYKDLSGKDLEIAIKKEIFEKEGSLRGTMKSQGTTPRKYVDLLSSLMDLTSGSGDKGTPIVLIRNYFKNFATC